MFCFWFFLILDTQTNYCKLSLPSLLREHRVNALVLYLTKVLSTAANVENDVAFLHL